MARSLLDPKGVQGSLLLLLFLFVFVFFVCGARIVVACLEQENLNPSHCMGPAPGIHDEAEQVPWCLCRVPQG